MGQAACHPPPSSDKAGLPVMAHPWSVLPQDSEGTGGSCQEAQGIVGTCRSVCARRDRELMCPTSPVLLDVTWRSP